MAHDMIFMTQCMASLKPTIVMFAGEFIRRHQSLSGDFSNLLILSAIEQFLEDADLRGFSEN